MYKPPKGYSKTKEYKHIYNKGYVAGRKRVTFWYLVKKWVGAV